MESMWVRAPPRTPFFLDLNLRCPLIKDLVVRIPSGLPKFMEFLKFAAAAVFSALLVGGLLTIVLAHIIKSSGGEAVKTGRKVRF